LNRFCASFHAWDELLFAIGWPPVVAMAVRAPGIARSCMVGRSPIRATPSDTERGPSSSEEDSMILATTTVEDFDRFERIFSTKGADKRKQHGSKGAQVFRDPNQDDRVWVLFDWDAEGWQSFISDPEVPPIMKEGGHKGRPQAAQLGHHYDA
jgi:heme-degrading monooxygenase HmoA